MRRPPRLSFGIGVVSLVLLIFGLSYGLVEVSLHSSQDCGSQSNGRYVRPGPDPCARTADDWHRATWWFIAPGLAGLLGAAAVGVAEWR
jgi:hypothetical protein